MHKVYQKLSKQDITAFLNFVGYFALPEYYLMLLREPKLWEGKPFNLTRAKVMTRLEKSVVALGKFASTFTFAKPRAELWKGVVSWYAGKQTRADSKLILISKRS